MIEDFYLEIEDTDESGPVGRGLRIVYKTVEQVHPPGPVETKGEKMSALEAKIVEYVRGENLKGRGVRGKSEINTGVEGRHSDKAVALDRLVDKGTIVDRPEKIRSRDRSRYWLAELAPSSLSESLRAQ